MPFLSTFFLAVVAATQASALILPRSAALSACQQLATTASSNASVYYPVVNLVQYEEGIEHWMSSSTQQPACVFEPAVPADVALALKYIAQGQVPFAVMGGGHASNPGFSSTTGLHISMTKFSQVIVSADKSTVEVGLGLVWDQIYSALEGTGLNVVGGRVPGVGVAGYTLGGGGYSWLTNQYGLTIDTVQSYNLVLPNGTITTITAAEEDLFFALKGGYNNYGIVTSFVLKTFPQPPVVYAGTRVYGPLQLPALMTAIANFSALSTDPRVQILPTLNALAGIPGMILILFFDGPKAELPANAFSFFDELIPVADTVQEQSFASFVNSIPAQVEGGSVFNSISLTALTPSILTQILNQTMFYAAQSLGESDVFVSYDIEPFLTSPAQNLFSSSQGGAYPHSPLTPYVPLNLYYSWVLPTSDAFWTQASITSAALLKAAAIAEGQDIEDAPIYPNYAVASTPLTSMYGDNVARMTSIKQSVDPTNIMGLAGGFKVPV